MTFLLIFGSFYALRLIYQKTSFSKEQTTINLNQPVGSKIYDYRIDKDNLYILVKGENISDRLIIIDTSNQTVLSSIQIN